jgi:3-hydroxyacyl-[acyl-carrier-protein] dehydratase
LPIFLKSFSNLTESQLQENTLQSLSESALGSPTLVVHMNQQYHYPMQLDLAAIKRFIPHREPMLFARHVTVMSANRFRGEAIWSADSFVFAGHLPGQPLLPGVMLLEAAAQIAGVGVLAGNPAGKPKSETQVGVLAAVRKCLFKRPIVPDQLVTFDLTSRQMAESLANISGEVFCEDQLVANLEFAFLQTPANKVIDALTQ